MAEDCVRLISTFWHFQILCVFGLLPCIRFWQFGICLFNSSACKAIKIARSPPFFLSLSLSAYNISKGEFSQRTRQ